MFIFPCIICSARKKSQGVSISIERSGGIISMAQSFWSECFLFFQTFHRNEIDRAVNCEDLGKILSSGIVY